MRKNKEKILSIKKLRYRDMNLIPYALSVSDRMVTRHITRLDNCSIFI